jgi:hypothetical protein
VRKLTILGPVKRVLPARVARYDRKWSISGSKTLLIRRKSSNRKAYFWQGISLFHYSARPILPFDIKPCLKAFFLIIFKRMSNKMSPFLLLVTICTVILMFMRLLESEYRQKCGFG